MQQHTRETAAGAAGVATGAGAGWVMGFIAGAAIGVGAGLLFAPKPGKETREMLKEKAIQVKDVATGAAEKVKVGAQQVGHDVSQTAQGVQEEVQRGMQQPPAGTARY